MKIYFLVFFVVFFPSAFLANNDSISNQLNTFADFRFRVEQDWDSKKSNGNYRDNRTRFRYRARLGFTYTYNHWASFGVRLRTGNPIKQQDPQITLGTGAKEFGTVPISFEKLYFKGQVKGFELSLGKFDFPFYKNNELFWSDNVFPEGISLKKKISLNSTIINKLNVTTSHFIVSSSGKTLDKDGFFQGYQLHTSMFSDRFNIFPSFYYFKNIENIPDGAGTYLIDYSIFHVGTKTTLTTNSKLMFEFDYYYNLNNYNKNDSITNSFKNEKTGYTTALSYGKLKNKGDWQAKITYNFFQRYAAVDFFAQNDWARWDYSNYNSPDGRLTNFQGIEIVGGYMLENKISLKVKYYIVEQLKAYGISKENGNRIRFDIDIKF